MNEYSWVFWIGLLRVGWIRDYKFWGFIETGRCYFRIGHLEFHRFRMSS